MQFLVRPTATLACAVIFAPYLSAQGSFVITWRESLLSVHADRAPLTELLREVARQTGTQIIGYERVNGTYSGDLADRLLVEGLALLLEDVNYIMAVNEPADRTTGSMIRIWLHSRHGTEGAQAGETSSPLTVDAEDTGGPVTQPESADADEVHLRQLESTGFFDEAVPSLLVDAALAESAVVRARALRALTERDLSMAPDVLAAALSDTDATVSSAAAELLDQVDGREVRERIGNLLQNSDPVIRFTALELLRRRPDPNILSYVQEALRDENEAIRATAESLLRELEVKALERKDDWPKVFERN